MVGKDAAKPASPAPAPAKVAAPKKVTPPSSTPSALAAKDVSITELSKTKIGLEKETEAVAPAYLQEILDDAPDSKDSNVQKLLVLQKSADKQFGDQSGTQSELADLSPGMSSQALVISSDQADELATALMDQFSLGKDKDQIKSTDPEAAPKIKKEKAEKLVIPKATIKVQKLALTAKLSEPPKAASVKKVVLKKEVKKAAISAPPKDTGTKAAAPGAPASQPTEIPKEALNNQFAIITRLAGRLNLTVTPDLLEKLTGDPKSVADELVSRALDGGMDGT